MSDKMSSWDSFLDAVILEGHTHKIDDDGLKIRLSRSV